MPLLPLPFLPEVQTLFAKTGPTQFLMAPGGTELPLPPDARERVWGLGRGIITDGDVAILEAYGTLNTAGQAGMGGAGNFLPANELWYGFRKPLVCETNPPVSLPGRQRKVDWSKEKVSAKKRCRKGVSRHAAFRTQRA